MMHAVDGYGEVNGIEGVVLDAGLWEARPYVLRGASRARIRWDERMWWDIVGTRGDEPL